MIRLIIIGLFFLLLFILQKEIYNSFWYRNLHVDIRFEKNHIFQGETSALVEVIENRKRLPLSMLKVKFKTDRHLIFGSEKGSLTTDHFYRNDMFRIGGGEKVTRTLKFTGGRRGYYTIDEASLVASDLLLASMFTEDMPVSTEIYVYPKPCDNEEFRRSLTRLNGEVLTRRHLLEDPFEYRGIREYQPFDPMRSINWKATAKTGDLKVNQKNYTSLKSVRVFFNVQDDGILKKEECVEESLRIVAGLCKFFINQGIQVSCYGNGVDILTERYVSIEAKAGEGHIDNIYRSLARVDLEKPTVNFCKAFEERLFSQADDTITCFVSPNQYNDFISLLTRFGNAGYEYFWFYPVLGMDEPELPHAVKSHVKVIHLGI